MNLEEMVKSFLTEHGYDGLYNADAECGCTVDDLMPCGEPSVFCEAGYKTPCDCGEGCDFHISPRREVRKHVAVAKERRRTS